MGLKAKQKGLLNYFVAVTVILVTSLSSLTTAEIDGSLRLPCQLPMVIGPCRAAYEVFFYNTTSKQCERFIYGGCGGNANRFATKEHCTDYCQTGVCSTMSCMMECPHGFAVDSNGCEACSCLKPGLSLLAPTLYTTNDTSSSSNSSNSSSRCPLLRKCQSMFCPDGFALDSNGCHTCECVSPAAAAKHSLATLRLPCLMTVDRGPCRAAKEYFFYNSTTNRCEAFVYGGCDGTANRFATLEHCSEYCRNGVCSALTCLMECPNGFAVDSNGCQICSCLEPGRSITAPTLPDETCPKRECPENNCPNGYEKDSDGCHTCECSSPVVERPGPNETRVLGMMRLPCYLEVDKGPCTGSKTRFFFNVTSKRCESFVYGGCKGSANRFSTFEHCTEYCKSDVCSAFNCLMLCPNGFAVDSNGCQICSCLETGRSIPAPMLPGQCPLRKCPAIYCPDGYEKDAAGCRTCKCASPVSKTGSAASSKPSGVPEGCSSSESSMCLMYCEHGFKVDERGCTLCECNDQPVCPNEQVSCQMFCEHGFKKSDRGCTLCECNPAPVCANISLTCRHTCAHGYLVDKAGCQVCQCRYPVGSFESCGLNDSCKAFCRYSPASTSTCSVCRCQMPPLTEALCDGLVAPDCVRSGCPHPRRSSQRHQGECDRCVCEADPCQSVECSEDQRCTVDYNGMTAKCVAGRRWCPDVTCAMYCENGYETGPNGCETCTCRHGKHPRECPWRDLQAALTCEFGPRYDSDGCRTDVCLPNPCDEYKSRCSNESVCEAYRVRGCGYCPAMARCIDISHVQWSKISLEYSVSREGLDELVVARLASEKFVREIESSSQCSLRQLSAKLRSSASHVLVQFHLVPSDKDSSFECDPVLTAKKFVSKLERREMDLNIFLNTRVTSDLSNIQVTYHSDDYVIDDVIPITYKSYITHLLQQQRSVVFAAAISSVVGLLVFGAMIVVICRRRHRKRPKTGYKKTSESDLIPSLM